MNLLIEDIKKLTSQYESFVQVILTQHRGSSPGEIGSRMLVTLEGYYSGSVGGGKIEAQCIKKAKELLAQKQPSQTFTWNLQKDIGMTCGGEVTLFFDVQNQQRFHVALFGAGHISQALCKTISELSLSVNVYESRKEWLDKIIDSSNIKKVLTDIPESFVDQSPSGSMIISLTRGHAYDLPILEKALTSQKEFSFIGVIGSDSKARTLIKELKANGVSSEQLKKLTCPIGLAFGNNTPPEIALSIAAQILSIRDKSL